MNKYQKKQKKIHDEEDEVYDKNVMGIRNYKLFSLREQSVINYNRLEKMTDYSN